MSIRAAFEYVDWRDFVFFFFLLNDRNLARLQQMNDFRNMLTIIWQTIYYFSGQFKYGLGQYVRRLENKLLWNW